MCMSWLLCCCFLYLMRVLFSFCHCSFVTAISTTLNSPFPCSRSPPTPAKSFFTQSSHLSRVCVLKLKNGLRIRGIPSAGSVTSPTSVICGDVTTLWLYSTIHCMSSRPDVRPPEGLIDDVRMAVLFMFIATVSNTCRCHSCACNSRLRVKVMSNRFFGGKKLQSWKMMGHQWMLLT